MRKVLLMGSPKAGKTSMYQVIFAQQLSSSTENIGYTVLKQQHKVTLMGSLTLTIWDCGSQKSFINQYFTTHQHTVFAEVELLLYLFDLVEDDTTFKESLNNFKNVLQKIKDNSPKAQIFILLHKYDLMSVHKKQTILSERKRFINGMAKSMKIEIGSIFCTSIYDQSLYLAWSSIVQTLIPKRQAVLSTLQHLCQACSCQEVILFENSTFLMLFHYKLQSKQSAVESQRLSTILKMIKISCNKAGSRFEEINVNTGGSQCLIVYFSAVFRVALISKTGDPLCHPICRLNASNAGKYLSVANC